MQTSKMPGFHVRLQYESTRRWRGINIGYGDFTHAPFFEGSHVSIILPSTPISTT